MSVAEPTPDIAAPNKAPPVGPIEDPNAHPVVQAGPAGPAPVPTEAFHTETGTTLLTYTAAGLTSDLVVGLARAAGHDVIGLPDQLDDSTWRVQVSAPVAPTAPEA